MSTATTEKSHSERQAAAQCESIVEMVRALNRETAAEDYAATLTAENIKSILAENEIEPDGEDEIEPDGEDLKALREQLAGLLANEEIESDGFEFDEDVARERIMEDPLSVEVRSGWQSLGETLEPSEFCILLCAGGPAVRIVGDLDRGEPSRPRVEHQDWGTLWTEYFPTEEEQAALQTYCHQFYFGE